MLAPAYSGEAGTSLLLARAVTPEQARFVGDQPGAYSCCLQPRVTAIETSGVALRSSTPAQCGTANRPRASARFGCRNVQVRHSVDIEFDVRRQPRCQRHGGTIEAQTERRRLFGNSSWGGA